MSDYSTRQERDKHILWIRRKYGWPVRDIAQASGTDASVVTEVIEDYIRRIADVSTKFKICSVCCQEYLADAAHFSRDRSTKDGLTARCKECLNKATRSRRLRDKQWEDAR